ncbi:MAG: two-component system, NtrC family, nitrogen regulation sensor histidine kinase NtrY [Acidobacteriota bacterium]|jgi:nitrogen fixation/metabolism regulation signal transduction histidine kinase|nr:two-component system, NtrC family, nitrogen regulation sensor histidine kinase NtrY [Acidobacteriota bacterium]
MSLRAKIIAYLVLIHAVLAVISFVVLWENRLWLLAVEGLFVLSVVLGFLLVRAFFVPLELIRTGAELIGERDFTSQFREVGQPEMDALIHVYNQMIGRLREERLKLQEQHYLLDRLLAASPAGIVTLDFDGRVTSLNPAAARLLQISQEEAKEKDLAGLAPPLGPALAAVPLGGSEVVSLQGGRRIKTSRAEFFDRGFPRSFLLLEELTEELRASERAAYGKLIRMMSHEINNSVGAVGSLLDSFRGYAPDLGTEDRDDFLQGITVAITRLENLRAFMNGFAEVVRLPPPDRRPTDVKQLVDEILILLRPELDKRRIAVAWEKSTSIPPIDLDRNQIEQVLVNVLKNAMESIGEDGAIVFRLGFEKGPPCLSIKDSGPGIPEDVRALLFTPFFSTKRNGRGLGLTLVQEILTAHGFDFSLGTGEGGGAEFRVGF